MPKLTEKKKNLKISKRVFLANKSHNYDYLDLSIVFQLVFVNAEVLESVSFISIPLMLDCTSNCCCFCY